MKTPLDLSNNDVTQILEWFMRFYLMDYLMSNKPRESYYCGITNNIEANLTRHKISEYLFCCKCKDANTAGAVECALGNLGFNIGQPNNPAGNGGADDSNIVYMFLGDGK